MPDPQRELELIAYPLAAKNDLPSLQPSPRIREWQRDTQDSYAARCLPLNIANNNGWQLLLPGGFDAVYSGGRGLVEISIYPHGDGPCVAASHFGEGVLTLFTGYLFRTPPAIHMQICGPINYIRDGVQALSGILETDWSPYNATMNYKFTRPGRARFRKGEPFAQVFPLPAAYVNQFHVRFGDMPIEDPETKADFDQWARSRAEFNQGLKDKCPAMVAQKWQKLYYRGLYPDGERKHGAHLTKLSPQAFSDSGLPAQSLEYQQSTCPADRASAGAKLPATALLRLDKIDWRLFRAIDELSTQVQDLIVFHKPDAKGVEGLMTEIPYTNVRLFPFQSDHNGFTMMKDFCRFDTILMMDANHILQAEFWRRFDDYTRLLDEKYEGIQLTRYRSKIDFGTVQKLDDVLSYPSDVLEPLHDTLTIMLKKECIGNSKIKLFLAKDKLILA